MDVLYLAMGLREVDDDGRGRENALSSVSDGDGESAVGISRYDSGLFIDAIHICDDRRVGISQRGGDVSSRASSDRK